MDADNSYTKGDVLLALLFHKMYADGDMIFKRALADGVIEEHDDGTYTFISRPWDKEPIDDECFENAITVDHFI